MGKNDNKQSWGAEWAQQPAVPPVQGVSKKMKRKQERANLAAERVAQAAARDAEVEARETTRREIAALLSIDGRSILNNPQPGDQLTLEPRVAPQPTGLKPFFRTVLLVGTKGDFLKAGWAVGYLDNSPDIFVVAGNHRELTTSPAESTASPRRGGSMNRPEAPGLSAVQPTVYTFAEWQKMLESQSSPQGYQAYKIVKAEALPPEGTAAILKASDIAGKNKREFEADLARATRGPFRR